MLRSWNISGRDLSQAVLDLSVWGLRKNSMSVLRKISPHLPGISAFSDWAQVNSSESVSSWIYFLCLSHSLLPLWMPPEGYIVVRVCQKEYVSFAISLLPLRMTPKGYIGKLEQAESYSLRCVLSSRGKLEDNYFLSWFKTALRVALSFSFKFFFSLYVYVSVATLRGLKRSLSPLELEFQGTVSCPTWVLRTELWSFARAVSALTRGVSCLALTKSHYTHNRRITLKK